MCYKMDIKCVDAQKEVNAGIEFAKKLFGDKIPEVQVIECMQGEHYALCNKLNYNIHELMPPRIKI